MEFSELYKLYDKQEEQNLRLKRGLEKRLEKNYLTFYEKALKRSKLDPLSFSLLFGLVLFSLHLTASIVEPGINPNTIAKDYSYFLSILNGVGLYLGISGSEKLREFIVNLIQLIDNKDDKREADVIYQNTANSFLEIYQDKFLGASSIYFGLLFGVINCILALIFGVGYHLHGQYFLFTTFMLQVFTIGFIGGITVNAVTTILMLIKKISIKDDIKLMYFYPDKCAGTLVVGNVLFLFSVNFILIGILIFLFLHNYDWTYQINIDDGDYYINALMLFWKTFPFFLAGIIFFFPAKKINAILTEYKLFEQLRIRKRLNYLSGIIISLESDKKESKERMEILDNHYQKLLQIDKQIEELHTWPYNLRYRATFLAIFLPVSIGAILEISRQFISNLF